MKKCYFCCFSHLTSFLFSPKWTGKNYFLFSIFWRLPFLSAVFEKCICTAQLCFHGSVDWNNVSRIYSYLNVSKGYIPDIKVPTSIHCILLWNYWAVIVYIVYNHYLDTVMKAETRYLYPTKGRHGYGVWKLT